MSESATETANESQNASAGEPPFALASPIGGAGFGMATFLIGMAYTGLFATNGGLATGFMMAMFFAGLVQGIAGLIELRRGSHALGFTHSIYGAWGLGQGMLVLGLGAGWLPAPSPAGWATYWFAWAIVTVIVAITIYPTSKWFSYVVWWLAICFLLLTAGQYMTGLLPIFGIALVIDALAAWYVTAAFSINESWGQSVVPVR